MDHVIRAKLTDLSALAIALKELEWFAGPGGYYLTGVTLDADGTATWSLAARPKPADPPPPSPAERRQTVEPGDDVVVETKGQQMVRRSGSSQAPGAQGTVFRVLTRGPHPHGMKVQLRDGTVGRVQKNLTAPGAGEPAAPR